MFNQLMLASAVAASEGGEKVGLLYVDGGLAFWTVLTFLLLLLILGKFAWKPILSALSEREKSIAESLSAAEKAREDAKKLMEENRKVMAAAEEEAKNFRMTARKEAEEAKNQLIEDAKVHAKNIVDAAAADINRLRQDAISDIQSQVAELSVAIAEKIIKKNLDPNSQKQIISDYINDIGRN